MEKGCSTCHKNLPLEPTGRCSWCDGKTCATCFKRTELEENGLCIVCIIMGSIDKDIADRVLKRIHREKGHLEAIRVKLLFNQHGVMQDVLRLKLRYYHQKRDRLLKNNKTIEAALHDKWIGDIQFLLTEMTNW